MITTTLTTTRENKVENGLEFIRSHLDDLWPRMVSTYATKGAQVEVGNPEEVMEWFRQVWSIDAILYLVTIRSN